MSFLSDYIRATEGNESPLNYHLWSAIGAMSAAAGRRFWFRLGRLVYYPHLYILLVGEPGVKKSTAMNVAKRLIVDSKICPVAASQATKEFLAKAMSHEKFPGKRFYTWRNDTIEYNQYAIFATEFTQFIAVNPEGMLEFFTSIYDEAVHSVDTKGQGSDYVVGPSITLLGCLTPHMLKGYLKTNVLTGGFARRTVFVYGFRERIIPIPEEPPAECIENMHAWIQRIKPKCGEFTFGPGAKEWYIEWYTKTQQSLKDISKPTTEGYYSTKQELLFKVAMMLALSETEGDDMRISPEYLQMAEDMFFKPIEENLERVFEGAGINPNAGVSAQICNMLEKMNMPMARKKIEAMFFGDATSYNDLKDTIGHLIIVGRLAERTLQSNGTFLGSVIGTPKSMEGKTDAELAAFL